MTDFKALLSALAAAGVDFIIVGGAAATVHGASKLTLDLDVVYSRTQTNLKALAAALAPFQPYLRGAPAGLPFSWDESALAAGLNFTLTTTIGDIDLFGEITGGGSYAALLPHSVLLSPYGIECRCLKLDELIRVKRAAGRPKDLEALGELEAIWEESEEP